MTGTRQSSFDSRLLEQVRQEAGPLAARIRAAADSSRGNEAQFIMSCDRLLDRFAERADLRWEPLGERRVVWEKEHVRRHGWIDRLFNRVVVEFKPPGSLGETNDASTNRHAIKQTRDYMNALISHEGWKSPSVAGVITDGYWFIFCRYSAGRWVEEAPVQADAASVSRFLRLLLTFQREPLLPAPLIKRFGAASATTSQTVNAFYDALGSPSHKLTTAVYAQWQEFFADVAGLDADSVRNKKELITFAQNVLGARKADPARLLFALYTYTALLTKLLAVCAVTPFFDTEDMDRLSHWSMLDSEDMLARLREVESGQFFRERKILNFTEGDFFGWYCDEWTPDIAARVKALLTELSEFDPGAVEQAPERVRDLLKQLYHGLLPRDVRHALGEYYTPDWLAERLLTQVDSELFGELPPSENARRAAAERVKDRLTDTRFTDPACGSGTFLVLIIRRLRQWAREAGISEQDRLLPALLKNVVGFDLNPLAVISSRANFLLAVADLLRGRSEPVELPVYLADSIVLPVETQYGGMFDEKDGVYELPLRGVKKKFSVPVALAARTTLDKLARLLRRDIEQGVDVQAFLDACENEFALPASLWLRCKPVLTALYKTLRSLHDEGRNGLWADIARNMFMPLFVGKADYVVGNPPWVNWQTLPSQYRERSMQAWQHYGLFVHSGMDTILGKGKKEVSTLLTYVAADLYLKPRGKLAFVIDRRVFKTSGASQGFRRFRLPDAALKVVSVDDFSAFQPFEHAANQTAVFVLNKGRPTTYPVPYNVWRKKTRTSPKFDAGLEDVLGLLRMTRAAAEPVDAQDATSAWLTAPKRLLPAIRKVLGQSAYRAYAGAYSGGANAVYWLRVLKHDRATVEVEQIRAKKGETRRAKTYTIEPDLLYPLLRGREVKRWLAAPDPSAFFLIVQDPATRRGIPEQDLAKSQPRTHTYLRSCAATLAKRKSQALRRLASKTFYSMFAVGPYTFAPWKVVWAEQGGFACAVVGHRDGKPIVPDHKVMLVPFDDPDEAYYVCAIANSAPFLLAVNAYAVAIQQDTHIFGYVNVPAYDANDRNHRQLSELSRKAHGIASGDASGVLSDIEREVNQCAALVWGLTSQELARVQAAVEE